LVIVEWSGVPSSKGMPKNARNDRLPGQEFLHRFPHVHQEMKPIRDLLGLRGRRSDGLDIREASDPE
jgi:hypothetical protein